MYYQGSKARVQQQQQANKSDENWPKSGKTAVVVRSDQDPCSYLSSAVAHREEGTSEVPAAKDPTTRSTCAKPSSRRGERNEVKGTIDD
jgi:hypothetical protein